jgi:protein SCO1
VLLAVCRPEPEIPTYWQAPAFALVDETGAPFTQEHIAGRVVLVDFIYTNCADVCPMLTSLMRAIQERLVSDRLLPAKVMLLSITVDPDRDTPVVLKQYGAAIGADPEGWKFLTGDRSALEETLVQGFKLPFRGPTPAGPARPGFEITHTSRVIVIDRAGAVRGITNGEELDVEQTVRTLKRLAS